jgi:hypothetical protein
MIIPFVGESVWLTHAKKGTWPRKWARDTGWRNVLEIVTINGKKYASLTKNNPYLVACDDICYHPDVIKIASSWGKPISPRGLLVYHDDVILKSTQKGAGS